MICYSQIYTEVPCRKANGPNALGQFLNRFLNRHIPFIAWQCCRPACRIVSRILDHLVLYFLLENTGFITVKYRYFTKCLGAVQTECGSTMCMRPKILSEISTIRLNSTVTNHVIYLYNQLNFKLYIGLAQIFAYD